MAGENVDSFYKNCDILLVPNRYQLAPRTKILEAMSAGKCSNLLKQHLLT